MKWLMDCLNSLYSIEDKPCTLPPLITKELSPIVPIDCKGCSKPCVHPTIPTDLKIDQSKPLKNTVPPYAIHIIIMTGKTNWPAHIQDEGLAKALIEAIHKRSDKRQDKYRFHPLFDDDISSSDRIIVTNCSLPSTHSRTGHDILLLPDNIIIANITPKRVDALLDYIFYQQSHQIFSTFPFPYSSLILVCGHGNKDRRCGTVGPIIEKVLVQASLNENVKIALVSHLGGHAFAGNLIVYSHYGQRAIWYGRVTPCYCKDIIENTVDNDKVLDNLVRGIFQVKSKPTVCSQQQQLDW